MVVLVALPNAFHVLLKASVTLEKRLINLKRVSRKNVRAVCLADEIQHHFSAVSPPLLQYRHLLVVLLASMFDGGYLSNHL